jgi:oligopeptide/dipeptide ABC transporter ATP-binding protein
MARGDAILTTEDLRIYYTGPRAGGLLGGKHLPVRAVDGVSLEVKEGQSLGLVGESGCGKSTIGFGILRLVASTSGRVVFDGSDVFSLEGRELRAFRRQAQIVFQDPYSSLHPRKRIGAILSEPLELHTDLSRSARRTEVGRLLEEVGLPRQFVRRYPHELSGGQRQRIAIARALALRPKLVILDEPLSALDVSIRAQVLELLRNLQRELGLTYVFISHDLALVRSLCESVVVMYLGKVVESGPTSTIFEAPAHPYTRALLTAVPVPDPDIEAKRPRVEIKGEIPTAVNPPSGCRFHPRCLFAKAICSDVPPPDYRTGPESISACHFWEEVRHASRDPVQTGQAASGNDGDDVV